MSQTPPQLGIRHAAIFVENLAQTATFWRDVMGYALEWKPDEDNVYLTCGGDNLALHRAAKPLAVQGQRLDHLGLAVASAEDVDAWAVHLENQHVTLAQAPKTHRDGARSLYFRDPGGTLVQIIHHHPISRP